MGAMLREPANGALTRLAAAGSLRPDMPRSISRRDPSGASVNAMVGRGRCHRRKPLSRSRETTEAMRGRAHDRPCPVPGTVTEVQQRIHRGEGAPLSGGLHAEHQPARSSTSRATHDAGFRARRARIGYQLGTERIGLSQWELPPGEAAYPFHYHLTEEELVIVLDGAPSLRTPDGWRELDAGRGRLVPARRARRAPARQPHRRDRPLPRREHARRSRHRLLPGLRQGRRVGAAAARRRCAGCSSGAATRSTTGKARRRPTRRSRGDPAAVERHAHLLSDAPLRRDPRADVHARGRSAVRRRRHAAVERRSRAANARGCPRLEQPVERERQRWCRAPVRVAVGRRPGLVCLPLPQLRAARRVALGAALRQAGSSRSRSAAARRPSSSVSATAAPPTATHQARSPRRSSRS